MAFRLKVDGLEEGAEVPRRFTCEGDNVSPELHWSGEPDGTRSFALIVDDPDAPAGIWNHWLVWNIPSDVHALRGGYKPAGPVRTGANDFKKLGYDGPCPPKGHGAHRYCFSIYALDVDSCDLPDGASRAELDEVVGRHALGTAKLTAVYERK